MDFVEQIEVDFARSQADLFACLLVRTLRLVTGQSTIHSDYHLLSIQSDLDLPDQRKAYRISL
jgi:hypothetical protein